MARAAFAGPVLWILCAQFFVVERVVASFWTTPRYDWKLNAISDLGATLCGTFDERLVCSPLHALMNAALVLLGLFLAAGSSLICMKLRGGRVGFSLMAAAGIGAALVGLFPENTVYWAHILGQDLAFVLGNIGMIVLGRTLRAPRWFKRYSVASGALALAALALFLSKHRLFLGLGGMERVVAYPMVSWTVVSGIYFLVSRRTPSAERARVSGS